MYSGIIINAHNNYRGIFGQKINLIDRKVALIVDVPFEIDNCLESGDLQRAIGIGGRGERKNESCKRKKEFV